MSVDGKLTRLNRLVGSDAGFYVLALHSFVEHYIRDVLGLSDAERFPEVTWDYRNHLLATAEGAFVDGLNCLSSFAKQHRFTNDVRHAFGEMDPEEAVAATHLFVVFCGLIDIATHPQVRELERSLHVWNARETIGEQNRVLHSLRDQLAELRAANTHLLERLSRFEEREAQLAELEHRIERYSLELERVRAGAKSKDERVNELRRERAELRQQKRELLHQMEDYEALERYIRTLGRFSVYTRTRLDYERTLMRLTPEQGEAVTAIGTDQDFLVRGAAGTGKSLVLIEALKRGLAVGELAFGDEPAERALLLTFNRTLAKFEDYVVQMLGITDVRRLVQTVDFFLLERLQRIDPSWRFDFEAVDRAVAELNTTGFLSDVELSAEIEIYLFGNMVDREEYVDAVMARTGMRRRLSRAQRESVWTIRDEVARRMDASGAFSRNYARLKIVEYLDGTEGVGSAAGAATPPAAALADVRTLYVDEAQDLTAGDLLVLRRLVTGHLIMAADTMQSIYGVASPFARAGLQISGRTRVLRTNFRNSRPIFEAARRFAGEAETGPFAFREGPPPELHSTGTPQALLPLLLAKLHLYLEHLGYEADNLCILVPHKAELVAVSEALSGAGVPSAVITEQDFSFAEAGAVRISTLHSSKGLDFPVVLMYLPYLNRREKFDAETTDRLLRNLIYVGMTRAMENLDVFVCPGKDAILTDLCRAMEGA